MELPPDHGVLALPLRAELFATLSALCRPATTQELAERVGRHHNTVRVKLQQLAAAGLVERRVVPQTRGRPRDTWAVAPDAEPAGRPPEAHGQLSGWLARALARGADVKSIETTGREIGLELAAGANGRPLEESLRDALAALGFMPRAEIRGPETLRFVLRNCPYREAVLLNQPAICSLHRGITRGLLDRLQPDATLTDFVAMHPLAAGCVIDVERAGP
jgi:predicted ArsR family transcriptional regulator